MEQNNHSLNILADVVRAFNSPRKLLSFSIFFVKCQFFSYLSSRLCSLTLTRLVLHKPLGADLNSVIIAVKMQVSYIVFTIPKSVPYGDDAASSLTFFLSSQVVYKELRLVLTKLSHLFFPLGSLRSIFSSFFREEKKFTSCVLAAFSSV